MKCECCDNNINDVPYKCSYCNEWFCKNHRLPEKHNCPQLKIQNIRNSKEYFSKILNIEIPNQAKPYDFNKKNTYKKEDPIIKGNYSGVGVGKKEYINTSKFNYTIDKPKSNLKTKLKKIFRLP